MAKQAKGLGKPITEDERMVGLDDMQQDILHDFLNGAKRLRQDLMTNNGHRQTIFSDTVLREMGLCLPRNEQEMKAIPGINPDMVDRYGRKFMLLINNTREMCGGIAPAPRKRAPQRWSATEELSDEAYDEEEDDEQVYDPNHQEVIDLCRDSDDDIAPPDEDLESNYSYGDSEDEEALHTSHHFTQPLDPEVAAFNNRLTQTMSANAAASKATASKRASRTSSSGPKKRGLQRKSGGSFGTSGFPGVRKRASSKARGTKTAGAPKRATGGALRRAGAGAGAGGGTGGGRDNGWSAIMGMPT